MVSCKLKAFQQLFQFREQMIGCKKIKVFYISSLLCRTKHYSNLLSPFILTLHVTEKGTDRSYAWPVALASLKRKDFFMPFSQFVFISYKDSKMHSIFCSITYSILLFSTFYKVIYSLYATTTPTKKRSCGATSLLFLSL